MGEMIFDLQRFDYIRNDKNHYWISGSDDDDTIYNNGDELSINGGAGNDDISNSGSSVTIDGGEGNDSIYSSYHERDISISGGAGNDYIRNASESNVTINGDTGDDSIENSCPNVSINGGLGNNYIINTDFGKDVKIKCDSGNDSIFNDGELITIDTGDGNDYISSGGYHPYRYITLISGNNAIIDTGDGNDTIKSCYGSNVMIDAGAGNDSISNESNKVTINAGKGNDEIFNDCYREDDGSIRYYFDNYGADVVFNYSEGDGKDTIWGFNETSTLSISGGSYSTTKSGDNIIVTVGKGKISLVGAATLSTVNIVGTEGSSDNATLLTVTDSTSSPVTVGAAVKTIDATARTKAIKITGNALANSIVGGSGKDSLYGGNGNDTILGNAGNDKLYGQNGNDFLKGGAGNNTLTGGDGNDVFIYGGGNDLITDYAAGDKIKINSGTISKATVSGKDVVFTIGTGKLTVKGGKQKTLTLINSSGVESQTVLGAATTSTLLNVTNSTSSPLTVGSAIKTVNASKRTKAIKITGNKLANSISGGSKNDTLYGGSGNDTILGNAGNDKLYGEAGNDLLKGGAGADTLSGGKGNDTLTGGAGSDVFIYSAGNDLITDFAASDTLSISSGTVSEVAASGDNLIFKIGTGKITLAGGANETVTYCDSDGEHTYPDTDTSSDVSISGKTIKLLEDYMEDSFNVADYGAKLQTIDASAVLFGINITGNKLMNSIIGSDDNDTLIGGKGNDSLTGGEGSDVFIYNNGDGNDVITDYDADDIISISSGNIDDISVSGKDVIFKVGSGKITVKNAKNKVISYVDAKGNPATYPQTVIISGTTAKLTESYMNDSFNAADYNSSIRTIDATAVLHDLEILGNKLANSIIGSENNETISGGAGNDTLTGGDGSDIFIYKSGDGNDLITDYAEEDKIQITSGSISTIKKSGSNVIFSVGSNKITVKGAATKTVTYIDKSGKTKYFPKKPSSDIILTDDNKTAILRETYSDSTYTAGSSIIKIDASSVTRDLTITGNSNANIILGGSEDDTIYGSKGHDTLQGGNGADFFVYASGDGNDRIVDYDENDTIQITKGTAKVATKGDDVIFTIGSGKLTLAGAANKTVTYIESGKTKTYGGSASNVLEDDNFITGNDLSALVQSKAVDYAFAKVETSLTSAKALPSITHSSKK